MGPAALRLAGSGPARRNPVSPAPVSWPGSVGGFFLDPVSKSSFTEEPDRLCPGPVAHCRSPQCARPVKVPCISPPAHPRPVNAFLPWYTHCSLSPQSSDPSSLPTRLTRSSWRLSVLFDVPFLPTRASPCPWSLPGHQERPRPSCCPVSSLPPSHHPQHDVLSSSSLALVPMH